MCARMRVCACMQHTRLVGAYGGKHRTEPNGPKDNVMVLIYIETFLSKTFAGKNEVMIQLYIYT